MKVLVLNGSPKKKSDTFRLTEAFLKGMNRKAPQEIRVIEEYAVSRTLSPETVAALEKPMLPKNVYLRHVNGT